MESNVGGAGAEADVRAYQARKQAVCVSSLLLVTPLAAAAATRAPVLGLDMFLGVACGIAYALLVMHANERLGGRSSGSVRAALGAHARSSVLRVFAFGAAPALTAALGPVWGMVLYFAGFFTPLALYALAVKREITTARNA